jgi:hypothetical protein
LVICLGVLAVLSLLAVSFYRLMAIERDASGNHRETVRAKFLAGAGVESAVAHLQQSLAQRVHIGRHEKIYYGDDVSIPIENSGRPSLYEAGQDVGPYAYSESLPVDSSASDRSRYHPQGWQYSLKVVDVGDCIDLSQFSQGLNGNVRVLNNLGRFLAQGQVVRRWVNNQRQGSNQNLGQMGGKIGEKLQNLFPGGYADPETFRRALLMIYGTSEALNQDLELLLRYVTFHGVRNPNTVSPVPGRNPGQPFLHDASQSHSRAPININTAGEVMLLSVLNGISARFEHPDGSVRYVQVTEKDARVVVRAILNRRPESFGDGRKPFSNWLEFADFLWDLVRQGSLSGGEAHWKAQVILANVCPEARLVKFNPDVVTRYMTRSGYIANSDMGSSTRIYIDKSDLVHYTVEFSLGSSGRFLVESLGRVLSREGRILASHKIQTVVRMFHAHEITTQKQFAEHMDSSKGVVIGPESIDLAATEPGRQVNRQQVSKVAGHVRVESSFTPYDQKIDPQLLFAAPREVDYSARRAKGNAEPLNSSGTPHPSLRSNQSKAGSVFLVGSHLVDGIRFGRRRYVTYDSSSHVPVDSGTVEFWVKMDEKALNQRGGLFLSTNKLGGTKGIHRVIYYDKGYIRASSTYVHFVGGKPDQVEKSSLRRVITGQKRPDAYERLYREGYEWLKKKRPGKNAKYYRAFGKLYARQILQAMGQGDTKVVSTYIYDAERAEGLGHIGCITKRTNVEERIPTVFKPGEYQVSLEKVETEAYLVAVNESSKYHYRFKTRMGSRGELKKFLKTYEQVTSKGLETPYEASRVEKGDFVKSRWKAGEWHHVRMTWFNGTSDLKLFLDGREVVGAIDDAFGPLEVWSSRQKILRDEFFVGAFRLERASGQGGEGSKGITGANPSLSMHTTLADFRIYNGARSIHRDRFRAQQADGYGLTLKIDPNSVFGKSWSAGVKYPACCLAYVRVPRNSSFGPLMTTELLVEGQTVGPQGKVPGGVDASNPIEVTIRFKEGSASSSLRQTAILESIQLYLMTPPQYLLWDEIGGKH